MTLALQPDPATQEIVARILADFAPPTSEIEWGDQEIRSELDDSDLPLPELARYVLADICGLAPQYPGEKTAWRYEGVFRGIPVELASEKFGLRCYLDADRVAREGIDAGQLVRDLTTTPPVTSPSSTSTAAFAAHTTTSPAGRRAALA